MNFVLQTTSLTTGTTIHAFTQTALYHNRDRLWFGDMNFWLGGGCFKSWN